MCQQTNEETNEQEIKQMSENVHAWWIDRAHLILPDRAAALWSTSPLPLPFCNGLVFDLAQFAGEPVTD